MTILSAAVVLVMSAIASLYAALPQIAVSTGADQTELTWIVDAYTLVTAALLLPAGALGDRYGRRGTLLVGTVLFALGNVAGALTDSPELLIAARAGTGVGAALILPSTLALITTVFPVAERVRAVGVWATAAVLGGLLGFAGSGIALQVVSWRGVFIGSAVLSAVLLLAIPLLRTSRDDQRRPLDLPGAVTSAAAIAALVTGIIEAPDRGWTSGFVLGALALGMGFGALFAVIELRRQAPLLDVRLFATPAFGSASLVLTTQFAGVFAWLFLAMLYLQGVLGWTPLESGLALMPVALTLVPAVLVSARVAAHWGARVCWALGTTGLAIAVAILALGDVGYGVFVVGLLAGGVGVGLTMATATTAIVDGVPASKQGVASAVNDLTREVGAALGVAVAGSLLTYGYREDLAAMSVDPRVLESASGAMQIAAATGDPQLAAAIAGAYLHGMRVAALGLIALLGLAVLATLLWAPGRVHAGRGRHARPRREPLAPEVVDLREPHLAVQ